MVCVLHLIPMVFWHIFQKILYWSCSSCARMALSKLKLRPEDPMMVPERQNITPNMQIHIIRKINVTGGLVDALDSFESLHCSATFLLELTDKSLAFSFQSFFAILCVPRDPFLDCHFLFWAGQSAFHAFEQAR